MVVRGPDTDLTVRRRDRVAGVWINHDAASLNGMPAYYYLASTRPLAQIAPPAALARYGIGVANLEPDTVHAHHDVEPFRQAALRLMTDKGLYREAPLRGGISQRDPVPRPCAGAGRGDARPI